MIRGIEGRRIFSVDGDRSDFLERLDALIPELDFRCFAWVLMPNHVHLAVRSGSVRLSRLMARLNTGYARSFNLRYERQGFLFQNRFRSRLVASEADLLAVIAYICRNPLEAGITSSISELSRWPWCGLSALAGVRPARPFEAVRETLAMLGDSRKMACRNLLQLVAAPSEEVLASHTPEGSAAYARAPGPSERNLDGVSGASSGTGVSGETTPGRLQDLIRSVCSDLGIQPSDLDRRQRTQSISRARAVIAYRAVVEYRIPGRSIAEALGVSPSAISHALERGRIALIKNKVGSP
jgi:REP element-mobilizing transposase RayT